MTNKGIILVVVLVLIVLGAGAVYMYNQQPSQANPNNSANYNPQVQGKIIFGVTDAAASMGSITSVTVTINNVQVHSQAQGWVTVSSATNQYDLLALKASGATSLLAQTNVQAGTYDQVRLAVSNVVLVANGVQQTVKLPSGELKIVGNVVVNANETSTVVFDFIADQSLHVTGNGKFIFVPVINLETRSNANVQANSNNEITINGGRIDSDIKAGMDVNGEMRANFVLDANARLDLVNDVLKVTVQGESDNSIKVTATTAINTAVNGGYLDSAISVTLITQNGKKEWLVSGFKNLILTSVYVDATTGAVVSNQQ